MGIEGTGSPSVSMRLGNDHADGQKQAKQFNEEINQAKEAADDDVSSSETAPQRPRQFTNEQIYGETKAAEERIDKQIEEDRSNSKISKDETNSAARFAAAHGTKDAFPEPGRKGWAVHAESPPKDGLGVGTCNVSAGELNRRGIIRDPFYMGFDLRLVRSADTGADRLEAFNPNTPGYYDAPDPGHLDFKKQTLQSPININQPPSMSSGGQSSYKEIMPDKKFPPPPLRPGSFEEYQAKLASALTIGINAPLLIVSELAGGNSQAMIEQSAPINGVINALGGTYQDAAAQPTLTPSRPTVSTTISSPSPTSNAARPKFAATSKGDIAIDPGVGQSRELRVAEIVGGRVARVGNKDAKVYALSGEVSRVSGRHFDTLKYASKEGVTVDVFGSNQELIVVGGPSKAQNLSKLGGDLRYLKNVADQHGVKALAYFEEGTPQDAIDVANKWLGKENVHIFR